MPRGGRPASAGALQDHVLSLVPPRLPDGPDGRRGSGVVTLPSAGQMRARMRPRARLGDELAAGRSFGHGLLLPRRRLLGRRRLLRRGVLGRRLLRGRRPASRCGLLRRSCGGRDRRRSLGCRRRLGDRGRRRRLRRSRLSAFRRGAGRAVAQPRDLGFLVLQGLPGLAKRAAAASRSGWAIPSWRCRWSQRRASRYEDDPAVRLVHLTGRGRTPSVAHGDDVATVLRTPCHVHVRQA